MSSPATGAAAAAPARPRILWSLLLLTPALLISLLFFVIPMLTVFYNSITAADRTGLSLEHYWNIVSDEFYWEVMLRTLRISLLTTVAALVCSYPAALYLYFSKSGWRRVFLFVLVSPLFVSVVVRTYGWIILLSSNGAINSLLPEPYRIKLLQTEAAIVIGLMHLYVPFMVLSLNAAMSKIDRRLLTAAASLGASNLRIFRDVLLPLSMPGIFSGCVIVFSISTTAFTTPVLLGGAKNKTMPYLIYQQNLLFSDWHLGSALAFTLLAVTLLIVYLLTRTADRANAEVLPQ
jgi:putative spermidine/putrescine transport system permease protein